ncbi:MAG: tripartite tricarboxylate transporter substrate binding protein [Tagaea sp.]|nr:tripartite tricarboxylate transporter substrate binding protein [Tagaea sp.]
MRRPHLASLALAFVLSLALPIATGSPALAQWPEKPIRMVVPFGPGGAADVLARAFQRALTEENLVSQPIIVQNVGGHFSVGTRQVMTAAPDGHTFLLIHLALLSGEVVDPARGVSYRNFEPVALTGGFCFFPVVRRDSPYRTLKDLVDAAKAAPGTIATGVNIGGLNHLMGLLLENAVPGAKLRYAQIGGGADNFAALVGGHTQLTVMSNGEFQAFKANGVRALAYSGKTRLPNDPDVPTLRESGVEFDFCPEYFWFAPKGTPRAAIDGMATVLEKANGSRRVLEHYEATAQTGQFMRGEAFAKYLDDTFKFIEPVARTAAAPR